MVLNVLIFAAGIAVYAGYGSAGLVYLLLTILLGFAAGRLIPRFPRLMHFSVAVQALALTAVKLQPVTGMTLPGILGISYFTLKVISYHVDLYREKYPPETNLLRWGLYVSYLPHLYLGPIERYDRFRIAAFDNRAVNWEGISTGALRVLWGLFKKLAIAARAGVLVSAIASDTEAYRGAFALAAMVLYYLQLYADFSGGIDIVIGVSRMLGIETSENFRLPVLAESVRDFWRRWHITLGSWLREYVYIPLGGSRKGQLRKAVNTLVVFLVSGLWHGTTYLLWGLLNGLFVVISDKCGTKSRLLNRIGTFAVISLLWAFFIWPDNLTALKMIGSVFTTCNYGSLCRELLNLGLGIGEWIVLAVSAGALLIWEPRPESAKKCWYRMAPAGRVALICALALVILVFGMYGIGFDVDAFIYSRF